MLPEVLLCVKQCARPQGLNYEQDSYVSYPPRACCDIRNVLNKQTLRMLQITTQHRAWIRDQGRLLG